MSEMMIGVKAIGMAAPGLPSWAEAQAVLRGESPYHAEELPRYAPSLLPSNERRRTTPVGRLAFQSAEEAIGVVNGEASHLASVFASSGGDTDIVCKICTALATEERLVSPTNFHNSVHNAAAGYWSIATGSHGASTSLSAYDGSYVAGLLEAAVLALGEDVDVLLVGYDVQVSEPLHDKRPIDDPFTSALILTADIENAPWRLRLSLSHEGDETVMENAALEALRQNNPSARALPLLQVLAAPQGGAVSLPGVDGLYLNIQIERAQD